MANRTVKDAHSVKGTNPQYLIEKIIRTRIYECRYWKEECFALTAELLVDKAMELKYLGGIFGGNVKPTPFLCLTLKMLQIQPEKDIIVEFIRNENFKYVRALGAFYMRLTGTTVDCFKYLEPLYYDYRKLKMQNRDGGFELIHMDEFVDLLLREERVCDTILPRIQKRHVLEENNQIEPRVSALDEDLEDMDTSDEEEAVERSPSPVERHRSHRDGKSNRSPSPRHRRSPSPHGRDRRKRSRSRDRDKRHRSPADKRHRDDPDKRRKSKKHRHDHKSHDSDRHRRHRDHKDRNRDRHRDRSDRKDDDSKMSKLELEIKEANEMRAKLGLPPLK